MVNTTEILDRLHENKQSIKGLTVQRAEVGAEAVAHMDQVKPFNSLGQCD